MRLKFGSYNIHKGVSTVARRLTVGQIRDQLDELKFDVLCLQEVQGQHDRLQRRWRDYPEQPHHDFIADKIGHSAVYGLNAQYDHGHHGNAVLSRLPFMRSSNLDISHHRLENRGMLHTVLLTSDVTRPRINVVCVHLGLFAVSRRYQLNMVAQALASRVPDNEPLIIAGDFNDWQGKPMAELCHTLNIKEAHLEKHGRYALTFPSRLPVMPLDRIFVRGFNVLDAQVHSGRKWAKLSDHALLSCELEMV
jgi:endonuclease/exonuclease/phosphatase family metal-dependent hydrolase